MSSLSPAPLTGPLYALSLASSAVIAALGLAFVLAGPTAAYWGFGIPVSTGSPFSLGMERQSASAYVAIIGVRDLTLAFMSICFTLLRDRRGAGLVKAGGIFATVGDSLVMLTYSEAPAFYIGVHVVTCIPLIALCVALLSGASKSSKMKQ